MVLKRDKLLFVGSFKTAAKDGSVGGQMFACRTLINSQLKNEFEFILIDSTADSVPAPPVYKRIGKVIVRFLKLVYYLIKDRPSKVLLFSSAGLSLLEKGVMAIIAKLFLTQVIFAPRSGLIKSDVYRSNFYKQFLKLVIFTSDVIICQGQSWKDFYLQISPKYKKKMVVVQNWIDTSVYINNNPEYDNKASFAKELIYIGWIENYKGIFDLIRSIALIKSEIEELSIIIYGAGKKLNEAQSLCIELGIAEKVVFKGWANIETKLMALSRADIYVLPSHTEGFPNALIEAMASGIPSIATRVGGIPDLIINNETGLLIESQNVDQLAAAILELYKNQKLREKLSKNGRNQVIKHNSLEAMYINLEPVLKKNS